jgi:probable blue pigment (indigoidine) exporter
VAAVIIAAQPVIVLALSRLILKTPLRPMAVIAGLGGILGVALLILQPGAALEPIGVLASVGGALSMALGTVLARLWQPPVSALTFTAWQLVAGGILLLPFALIFEAPLAAPSLGEWLAYLWLGLFGAAISYVLWFRGIARLGPSAASPLVLMSPVTAVLIGWLVHGERFTPLQAAGVALVLASVWGSQRALAASSTASSPARAAPAR